jgi:PTH1 family peptidyl-tRNA hydrolase
MATVAEVGIAGQRVTLGEPTTFMNDSGQAVAPMCRRFGLTDHERLVIVHDELDLPAGRMKVKAGGGLAGHNGLRSITAHLHTQDYLRVRIGVGKPPSAASGADHVLRKVSRRDRAVLDVVIEHAADAVEMVVADGVTVAMERYNSLDVSGEP